MTLYFLVETRNLARKAAAQRSAKTGPAIVLMLVALLMLDNR